MIWEYTGVRYIRYEMRITMYFFIAIQINLYAKIFFFQGKANPPEKATNRHSTEI